MLSYLHGYHAGNAADVLKHSALVFCLDYLRKKEKPLLCVDTHAGAGLYNLTGADPKPRAEGSPHADSRQNREWEKGIGRLLETTEELPAMIASYVKLAYLRSLGLRPLGGEPVRYSGSPLIAAMSLRKGDRLVCFELHPGELDALKVSMAGICGEDWPLVEVRGEDGTAGLLSLLPPPSRRGLILIDPSWEDLSEYESIPQAVLKGLKRFPTGTFIIWYPLLALPRGKSHSSRCDLPPGDVLFGLSNGKRLRVELMTGKAESSPRLMYGSGLVIFNPPWTLRPALEEALPYLAKVLGGNEGSWQLCFTE